MSDIVSKLLEKSVLLDWLFAGFSLLMLSLMFVLPGQETIPYHLLFLSLGLVYGLRVWGLAVIASVLLATTLITGIVMVLHWTQEYIEAPELCEVPLMPALIVAMVWHARRRAEAQRQVAVMADERAAHLERQQQFLRDACHAIRTPVTIARGHLDLVQSTISDPENRSDLSVVGSELDRMTRLSSRLMAIAELDQGDSLILRPVDLAALVADTGQHWAHTVDRHWVIDVSPTGQVPVAQDWIEQTVDALVENAVRFTTPDDTIRLSCRLALGRAILEVADSGPGIRATDREHVFDRFWKRHSAQGSAGSGLGLATVQSVVHAHGGSVSCDTAPEGGALLSLSLPASAPDGTRPIQGQEHPHADPAPSLAEPSVI